MQRLSGFAVLLLTLVATSLVGQTEFSSAAGLNLAIPDATYDGTFSSMACHAISVGSFGEVDEAVVRIAATHTSIGDLTIKLRSPAGTVVTLVSRPGADEPADDGSNDSLTGDSSNLNAADPVTFVQSAATEAEEMGASLTSTQVVCRDDGVCSFNPNAGSATTSDDLATAFDGESGTGTWTLCIGDSLTGDAGTLDSWSLTLTAAATAPEITSAPPPNGGVGTPYEYTMTATGTAPITWAVTSGTLPDGLSLDSATGVISGTPQTAGTWSGTITASNGTAPADSQEFAITIAKADQTIDFENPGDQTFSTEPVTLTASSTSGLAVTFVSLTAEVCQVAGNSVMMLDVGTCSIRADQSGDANYNPAPSVTQSFLIQPAAHAVGIPTLSPMTLAALALLLALVASTRM